MKRRFLALALAAAMLLAQSAFAYPIADWRAESLLAQVPEAKKELGLTENQTLLWEQGIRKTRAILRLRKERHDALDAAAHKTAAEPGAELRTLAAVLQDDAASRHDEDKELREVWFTMNDALDDRQRGLVLARFRSMLERQPPPTDRGEGRPERGGKPEGAGRGGRGPGGMPGNGNGGIGIGMGRGL